ncbi:MAG: glycoside hydrolase family 13 protein [Lachnospiraceae bacterium]|nr:glycoside hydrolase family 13 protein [Lachnospiraceae bacterium]
MDYDRFSKMERRQYYINDMRPLLDKQALFSDTSEDYLIPHEPNPYSRIRVRFRSAKNNIDHVFFSCKGQKELMTKVSSDELFDFYELEYQLDNEPINYHFVIRAGKLTCFFDMRGVAKNEDPHFGFKVIPGFKTPKWAKGAVIYQIYVDRFYNGDPSNDVLTDEYVYIGEKTIKAEDWYQYPASMDVRTFYGGDLQGVMDKLDYLKDLGIDAIYFNPLFVSPSNHKYDIQDYDYIDPHIGKIVNDEGELLRPDQHENKEATRYIKRVTDRANLEASNRLFIRLVEEAHKRGIKVIIDGVFNHCGSFNKWLDRERIYESAAGYEKGAYIDENSPYHNFFHFHEKDKWPYNGSYDGWWGHDTLPKLNYEASRQLCDYILYIARKWVSPPYNVDGWRLDVAADLGHSPEFNHRFWQDFRHTVKGANPDAIILAEHYGDPSSWLQGDQWDTVMNYDAFMEPITWFLTGMQKHSDDYRPDMVGNAKSFWDTMQFQGNHFANPSLLVAMNELSNHDHSRFLTRTNHKVGRTNTLGPEAANEGVNKAVMRQAVLFQMTWIGAPTIYYGDEAGLCGFTDPDNRRTYPWGREDKELIAYHKSLIRIHKANRELIDGALKFVLSEQNLIAFGRMKKEECCLIILNTGEKEVMREIPVWYLGVPLETVMERLMFTTEAGYDDNIEEYYVISGKVMVSLPKTSGILLKYKARDTKNFFF